MELTNLFPTPIHLQEKKHWEGGVSKIYVYIYIYIYIERERERERDYRVCTLEITKDHGISKF